MSQFILVTESGADLPQKYIDRFNIKIVPMYVNFGENTFKDSDIKAEDVFDYYEKNKILPTTSGSTPNDFTEIFRNINVTYLDAEIIYIAYSSVTTVSFNSARIAAEEFSNVHMIDSKNCTVGLGTVVIAAAEYIENNPGAEAQDIIQFVEEIRERTRFVFLPYSLLYLKAGGRISNASYIGAMLLKIYPTINLENGYLVAGSKYRGSFKKAYKNMIDKFFSRFELDRETIRLVKVHGLEKKDIIEIETILKEQGVTKTEWVDAGAVISCHGGPGAVGLAGIENK
ncbi:DegV family protein [Gallicola sp. Sow4_E12]|uniref:DegV family protein n=1 Tax=Gallicola sp. Sow4_E12 TaxID=3438785 RepID=UPI003F91FC42